MSDSVRGATAEGEPAEGHGGGAAAGEPALPLPAGDAPPATAAPAGGLHATADREIALLEGHAARLAGGQRSWAAWWRFVETWVGLAVAVLSALAAVDILTADQYRVSAAVLALTASGLSSVLGFVKPADRARKAEMLVLRCDEFERRARYERTMTLPALDATQARELVMAAADRWDALRWDDVKDQLDQLDQRDAAAG